MEYLRSGSFIKLSFKALKAIPSTSSHKTGLDLLLSKTDSAIREKFTESNFGNNQIAQENVRLGLGKLRTDKVYLDPGVAFVLITHATY